MTKGSLFIALTLLSACAQPKKIAEDKGKPLTEFSDYYSTPTTANFYSQYVADTFRIFKSLPKGYSPDSTRTYPLIIILDANAFFEATVSELKFNSFIGLIPRSIVIGVGYADFPTMDSLRSRDYTYPTAIPEYEMTLSGGADNFKRFIDEELVPKLRKEFKIDLNRSAICGHSLGGYFTLYYGLKSIENNSFTIRNIISASPSLHYNHGYVLDLENQLGKLANDVPLHFYISMGSEDLGDDETKALFKAVGNQVAEKFKGLRLKKAEYTNFGHIDAAIPGFIKGLAYVFEE